MLTTTISTVCFLYFQRGAGIRGFHERSSPKAVCCLGLGDPNLWVQASCSKSSSRINGSSAASSGIPYIRSGFGSHELATERG